MKVYLITFAEGKIYEESQKKLNKTLKIADIDEHILWNMDKIKKTKFYEKNKKLLDIKLGNGYWSWKPFIILEKLKHIKNDDVLIYMDSSRYETDGFKNSCLGVINFMNKNKINILPGFETNYKNYQMIKRVCLDYFNLNNDMFKNTNNVFTSPMFLKNTDFTLKFISEWLKYCLIEENVSYCDLSDIGGKVHIYDQAVLNCLISKYQIKSFKPETKDENEFRKFTYYFDYFDKHN
tara:strand:- start:617 stop:1324 length:708 start_codon:yes stop_codon:yes gene_type:complete